MKQTRIMMDMPITVEIVEKNVNQDSLDKIFDYFIYIDEKFSIFKKESEISKINRHELKKNKYTSDMKTILTLSEKTRKETDGYFNINRGGLLDPSGIVKGWAIYKACQLIDKMGYKNYYVEAGGDIQVKGNNPQGKVWKIGIRNPFNRFENVKIVTLKNKGIATSGIYIRGNHIQNPHRPNQKIDDIVSLTVIGPNVYEADRFATAAFAMGNKGIEFIEGLKGFEGYVIDKNKFATATTGFNNYVLKS